MTAFPDLLTVGGASNPLRETISHKTITTAFETGDPQRKKKWLYPRRKFELQYKNISKSDARTLWQFFMARGGRYDEFNLFHPMTDSYVGEYVGTGDGSETVWNMPSKQAQNVDIYVNGVEQDQTASSPDVTFTSEGGADGADTIEFTTAPDSGAYITTDFTGYLKVRAYFEEDEMSFDNFYNRLLTFGLKIQGMLNA